MNELLPIDFHGDTVWVAPPSRKQDEPMVAVRALVEGFGLSWPAQFRRIQRDEVLAEGIAIMATPSEGGVQETVCLPLSLLPGFVFGFTPSRIPNPAIRAKLKLFRREGYRAIYEHFFGRAAERQARAARSELRDKLKAVQIAMQLSTRAAARNVWNELGLPTLPEGEPAAAATRGNRTKVIVEAPFDLPGDDAREVAVRQFLVERLEPHTGSTIPTGELYEAYLAWAAELGAETLSSNGFGVLTTRLRLPKGRRGATRHYRNLRFKPAGQETLQ